MRSPHSQPPHSSTTPLRPALLLTLLAALASAGRAQMPVLSPGAPPAAPSFLSSPDPTRPDPTSPDPSTPNPALPDQPEPLPDHSAQAEPPAPVLLPPGPQITVTSPAATAPVAAPFIGPLLPPLTPPAATPPLIGPLLPPVTLPTTPPVIPLPGPGPAQPGPAQPGPKPVTVQPNPGQPDPAQAELGAVRGLWVDAFGPGLKTPAQVAQMVRDARSLGVNTLFVQTIRRADCLCNRSSVPRASDRDLTPGFDPLAEVLRLAHAQGIRVFAWVSVTGAGNAAVPNTSPQHILKAHGPAAGLQSWVNRRPDGSYLEGSDIWLDAGIPGAADFMVQSILSIVKNYDVDGIQLDRIRYPDGGAWGYSPQALTRYRTETGVRGTPTPSDPAWTNWKREQITALVRRVVLETRRLKSNVWTSAATITYGAPPADLSGFRKSRTYSDVLQNWPAWTEEGLIDLNVLMNYKQDLVPNHIAWFDDWNKFALSVRGKAEVAAGTALYLNSPDISRRQMQRALNAGLGWVGYAYRTPGVDVYKNGQSQPQGLAVLRKTLTERGGPLTSTTWDIAPPTRYALLGRITGSAQPGGRPVEARSQSGTLLARTVTDGSGYYGFTDLPLGTVEVRVAGQRWQGQLSRPGVVRYPDLLVRDAQIIPALK